MTDETPEPFAGRYRLVDELGVGGAGTVWRAEDLQDGGECAVKIVEAAGPGGALHRRLVREASILAELSHPNLVRLLDYGTAGGDGYLAMELVDGPNLHELVEQGGPVEPERAVALVLGVLGGLQAAHEAGIVHRDVKPSNVMIGADGRPRLSDFGIARDADATTHLTATGTLLGTYAFAAPEQLEDPRGAGPQADVYAAGATLAYLVTGRMPFGLHDTSRQEELLGELPVALARVICQAVASAPEDRPDGARGLALALRGERPPTTQRRGVARLAIGVTLVAVAASGLMLSQGGETIPGSPVPEPAAVLVDEPAEEEPAPVPLEGVADTEVQPPPAAPPDRPEAPREEVVQGEPAPAVAEAEVAEEAESSEDAEVVPPLEPVGVVLNSFPYSEVSVDGRPLGRTPVRVEVAPGVHRVQLETADGRVQEQAVEFSDTMASPWCWDFTRQAACGS